MSYFSKQINTYLDNMYSDILNETASSGLAQTGLVKAYSIYGGIGSAIGGGLGAGIGYAMSDNYNDYTLTGGLAGAAGGALGGVGLVTGGKSLANNLRRGMDKYPNQLSMVGHELAAEGKKIRKSFWSGLNEVYPG